MKNAKFLNIFSSLLLLTATLSAEIPTTAETENVVRNNRPMTEEEEQIMLEKRIAEKDQMEPQEDTLAAAYLPNATAGCARAFSVNSYYPVNWHWVNLVAAFGDLVEFEDGSQWNISPSDWYKAQAWRPSDALVITPMTNPFSPNEVYIKNKTTNTTVEAKLSDVGPVAFGAHTRWIVEKDFSGRIRLNNGTVWVIHPFDHYLLSQWLKNDTIILGLSDSWFTNYDTILINVNRSGKVLNYARAKLQQ